jgi:hypothetical protein
MKFLNSECLKCQLLVPFQCYKEKNEVEIFLILFSQKKGLQPVCENCPRITNYYQICETWPRGNWSNFFIKNDNLPCAKNNINVFTKY